MGVGFGLQESILGLWESIFGPGSQFGALRFNFVHLAWESDFGPVGVDFRLVRFHFGPLEVGF